jgi:hypothetical protein
MMNFMRVEFDGVLYALLFVNQPLQEGAHFLTPDSMPLQLGFLVHPSGKSIKPHAHRHQDKLVKSTYEVLYIIEGRIELQFYSLEGRLLGTRQMSSGDAVILMDGGHGLKVLESCRILEVKQGPYFGTDVEKLFFTDVQS